MQTEVLRFRSAAGTLAVLLLGCMAATGHADERAARARAALEQAIAVAARIEAPHRRAQAFARIAAAYGGHGEEERARETIAAALAAARLVPVEALQNWALHDIALAQARIRDRAGALATAERIEDGSVRDLVLAELTNIQLADSDFDAALATAGRIRRSTSQGAALRIVAAAQTIRGDLSGALVTARRILDATENALALADIAAAHAADRDVDEARSLAARIRDKDLRAHALGLVATAQMRSGDVAGAHASAALIGTKREQALTLVRMAGAQAAWGDEKSARSLLASAVPGIERARGPAEWRSSAWSDIAAAALALDDTEQARASLAEAFAAAQGVRNVGLRDRLLAAVARRQARADDVPGALHTATHIVEASSKVLVERDVVVLQAEAGKHTEAVMTARALGTPHSQAAALLGILGAQMRSGDSAQLSVTTDLALSAVRRVADAEFRAGALTALALAREESAETTAARLLFDEAMAASASLEEPSRRVAAYVLIAERLSAERGPSPPDDAESAG